ncbi:hypothetical protein Kisp01_50860 [Kineosporia sp. NBRC 101677]|nr:hypothetical protein Kisp01_50860 [Kineosporia sp. NBRC 101677]
MGVALQRAERLQLQAAGAGGTRATGERADRDHPERAGHQAQGPDLQAAHRSAVAQQHGGSERHPRHDDVERELQTEAAAEGQRVLEPVPVGDGDKGFQGDHRLMMGRRH